MKRLIAGIATVVVVVVAIAGVEKLIRVRAWKCEKL